MFVQAQIATAGMSGLPVVTEFAGHLELATPLVVPVDAPWAHMAGTWQVRFATSGDQRWVAASSVNIRRHIYLQRNKKLPRECWGPGRANCHMSVLGFRVQVRSCSQWCVSITHTIVLDRVGGGRNPL
eukprot:1176600-Prorocentrum_minimum.AAC.3